MAISLLMLCINCSEVKTIKPFELPSNSASLIAGDRSKTWKLARRYNGRTRMNMENCFLSYRQTYSVTGAVSDNNGKGSNCGESLVGQWQLIKDSLGYSYIQVSSPQIPELMGIEEGFKNFRIFYLSKDSLHISFEHTQFGERRRISDYLVQEDIAVADRDFHF